MTWFKITSSNGRKSHLPQAEIGKLLPQGVLPAAAPMMSPSVNPPVPLKRLQSPHVTFSKANTLQQVGVGQWP